MDNLSRKRTIKDNMLQLSEVATTRSKDKTKVEYLNDACKYLIESTHSEDDLLRQILSLEDANPAENEATGRKALNELAKNSRSSLFARDVTRGTTKCLWVLFKKSRSTEGDSPAALKTWLLSKNLAVNNNGNNYDVDMRHLCDKISDKYLSSISKEQTGRVALGSEGYSKAQIDLNVFDYKPAKVALTKCNILFEETETKNLESIASYFSGERLSYRSYTALGIFPPYRDQQKTIIFNAAKLNSPSSKSYLKQDGQPKLILANKYNNDLRNKLKLVKGLVILALRDKKQQQQAVQGGFTVVDPDSPDFVENVEKELSRRAINNPSQLDRVLEKKLDQAALQKFAADIKDGKISDKQDHYAYVQNILNGKIEDPAAHRLIAQAIKTGKIRAENVICNFIKACSWGKVSDPECYKLITELFTSAQFHFSAVTQREYARFISHNAAVLSAAGKLQFGKSIQEGKVTDPEAIKVIAATIKKDPRLVPYVSLASLFKLAQSAPAQLSNADVAAAITAANIEQWLANKVETEASIAETLYERKLVLNYPEAQNLIKELKKLDPVVAKELLTAFLKSHLLFMQSNTEENLNILAKLKKDNLLLDGDLEFTKPDIAETAWEASGLDPEDYSTIFSKNGKTAILIDPDHKDGNGLLNKLNPSWPQHAMLIDLNTKQAINLFPGAEESKSYPIWLQNVYNQENSFGKLLSDKLVNALDNIFIIGANEIRKEKGIEAPENQEEEEAFEKFKNQQKTDLKQGLNNIITLKHPGFSDAAKKFWQGLNDTTEIIDLYGLRFAPSDANDPNAVQNKFIETYENNSMSTTGTKMKDLIEQIKTEICANDNAKIFAVAVVVGLAAGASALGTNASAIIFFRVLCGALLTDLEHQKKYLKTLPSQDEFKTFNNNQSVQHVICKTTKCSEEALQRVFSSYADKKDIYQMLIQVLSAA